jgi:hypothetical protein
MDRGIEQERAGVRTTVNPRRLANVRWIAASGVGAAAIAIGVLTLYLGPFFYRLGPISDLLDRLPTLLFSGGAITMLVGVAGVSVSLVRTPSGSTAPGGRARFADVAASIGLAITAAAILTPVLVSMATSILVPSGPGPCDYNGSPACFAAHPDYYQPTTDGYGWTTPGSRLGTFLMPFYLAAWPAALLGGMISLVALVTGTARRRTAIAGLILGTLVVVGMVVQLLALWFIPGGGE